VLAEQVAALNAALILLADHALAASTFAAGHRVGVGRAVSTATATRADLLLARLDRGRPSLRAPGTAVDLRYP
jgi:hypothetical protein